MQTGRTALSIILAASLAACGGGGGSSPPPIGGTPTPSPTPTPTPTTSACSLSERQDFAFAVLDEWYLFPDLIDRSVQKSDHSTVQSYLDALVAPARAQNKDRGFTFVTSIEEENELIRTGSSAGFGIRLAYDTSANRVFVLEAFESAPGFQVGFDRGTELLQIGTSASTLESIRTIMANEGPQGVIQRLGDSQPGVQRTFVIARFDGTNQQQVTATKAEFSLDPISDRYGASIIDNGGTKVGYLNLRTFIVGTADAELIDIFQDFSDQGVTEVVLDFRYNGGGLVRIGELIGDLMRNGWTGQVFSRTTLRPSKASNNETRLFENTARLLNPNTGELGSPQSIPFINPMKIAVISGPGTASASELVANAFLPYVDQMALVGRNSFGKPVGQFGFDLAECDDRIRAVTFKTENADGQGEYFDGLASVFPITCAAPDDITEQLGDPNEASVAQALAFLRTGAPACTPITGVAGVQRTQSSRNERLLLQPDNPSAVQREVPGLY